MKREGKHGNQNNLCGLIVKVLYCSQASVHNQSLILMSLGSLFKVEPIFHLFKVGKMISQLTGVGVVGLKLLLHNYVVNHRECSKHYGAVDKSKQQHRETQILDI